MLDNIFMDSILQSILPLVPSSSFDQVVITVPRITGKCIIPQSLLSGGDSKLIVAMKSDVDPSFAVSTTNQSLVFHGVVFQYLTSTQSWMIHSQFCGAHFSPDSCSLKSIPTLLGGKSLMFQRSKQDMSSLMEHWTFRALSVSEYPVLHIIKVQEVFRDMYIKQNATTIGSLQQKFDIKSNQILSLLNELP